MIILAAGLSNRMGDFKPLLPVGKRPAILRDIQTAQKAGVREIIVVTGHMREKIENIVSETAPDVRLVCNDRYENGMFSSVRAGISALPAEADGFFLLPADCCAVSSGTLSALMGRVAYDGPVVLHPTYKGRRGHPPLIPARCADRIALYEGKDGLKGALDALESVDIETNDPGVLLDMDTPEDYKAMLAYLGAAVPHRQAGNR